MKITSTKVIAGALVVIASPIAFVGLVGSLLLANGAMQKAAHESGKNIQFASWIIQKPQCLPRQLWNEMNDVSAGGKYATYIKHCRV